MSRRLRVWLAALLLLLALLTSHGAPQAASASKEDDDEDDATSGAAASAGSTTLTPGAALLASLLSDDGDALLIRRIAGYWTESKAPLCTNAPFILSRDGPSNQNCLPALNELGLSCTCLTGFVKESLSWNFKVAEKVKPTGTPPKAIPASSIVSVTKIAPTSPMEGVETVSIIGSGDSVPKFTFTDDIIKTGSVEPPRLQTSKGSKAVLKTVQLENVDFGGVLSASDFFPATVTQLKLRNCRLQDGDTLFLSTLSSLDVVDLENNNFTQIPEELLQLPGVEQAFLGGNPIIGATVTEKNYQIIKALKVFSVDATASATRCPNGVLKVAHDVSFCVSSAASVPSTRAPQSVPQGGQDGSRQTGATGVNDAEPSSTNKFLFIGAISGAVVIVILIFFIVRRRSARHKEDAFVKQTDHSIRDDTVSFDHSKDSQQSAVDSSLLNDPIIITHRIPFNDVKVATCLSRGGFGLVYSGTFNRRRVAIKRIRSELSADIKYIEAFLKEICLMASLSHPRIVEFVGVAWDSLRNLSAVTEFMERGDLRDVLHSSKARNAPLTWDGHKVRIAMHIAEALTYLHSLSPKVIHRDLKSKNVLLDSDMTAKLSDFGVSRERRFEETHMTAGIGTAFWIAPEVLLGMDYDERADIFSFGVVLSEIDTDDYPYWNEKNPASGGKQQENVILRMVATGALRPEFSPSCPGAILELAQLCLDVDPLKRPTAAEITYRLQQLIRSSPLTAQSSFSS